MAPLPTKSRVRKSEKQIMPNPQTSDETTTVQRRWALPSWLASLVVHLAICLALAVAWHSRESRGLGGGGNELTATIGNGPSGDYYDSPGDGQEEGARSTLPEGMFVETVLNPSPGVQPSVLAAGNGPGANGGPPGGPGSESLFPGEPTNGRGTGTKGKGRGSGLGAGGLTSGPGQPRAGSGKGTATTFFIKDQGNSFVFCIDRSASMSQSGRLAAAKSELLNALKNLDKTNQFQIIFYNDKMDVFRPQGNRAFFADEQAKRLAQRWVGAVTADGPTDGFLQALRAAVLYHPDVVYFLTDGEDISLSDSQLA